MSTRKLKTLKTLLVEAVITYLADRDKRPHITIEWETLDKLNGSVDNGPRTDTHIVLNLASQATNAFDTTNNAFIFNVRFGGVDTMCVVPTASIQSVYDPDTMAGMVFEPAHDLAVELDELTDLSDNKTRSTKNAILGDDASNDKPKRVSHLTSVK
jgi:stringent starvation protein B